MSILALHFNSIQDTHVRKDICVSRVGLIGLLSLFVMSLLPGGWGWGHLFCGGCSSMGVTDKERDKRDTRKRAFFENSGILAG